MKHLLLAVIATSLLGICSCKKDRIIQPAVVVNVISVSYPTTEPDYYYSRIATVELKKTDGSYSIKEYIPANGQHTFGDLTPGEYWINEESTRQSEKFMLGAEETQEIAFTIP
jgi:hypothetical protein